MACYRLMEGFASDISYHLFISNIYYRQNRTETAMPLITIFLKGMLHPSSQQVSHKIQAENVRL